LPIIVRFAGNNADFALVRLKAAGVAFEAATDMADAITKAVAASRAV
jgi:succinyl-CoA synthetase beta subunit